MDAQPEVNLTLGSMEIGTLISSVLYGIVMIQVYTYFQASFAKDGLLLKLLETLHSIILWIFLYSKSVTSFGQVDQIPETNVFSALIWPLSGIITCIVQVYFTYRIYKMTLSYYYPAFLVPTSLLRLAFAVWIGAIAHKGSILKLLTKFKWLGIIELVGGAVIDITNTVFLCYYLEQNHKILASMKTTDRLIIWTIGKLFSSSDPKIKTETRISKKLAWLRGKNIRPY
ncbi:hypothetical protein K435DRAFT_929201 [Dendrothele bispora CBS 962.96]|uniref:Uncharacterized protein n=1 Tax=Dendrothele bispora (strain CBS 962.96) TaxID=1314807 RepID=A0A4S8L5V2_DENBC|nr:hypothetical protein K435DRAFT_929201 [Dendrothele bispora CBS 962.96]